MVDKHKKTKYKSNDISHEKNSGDKIAAIGVINSAATADTVRGMKNEIPVVLPERSETPMKLKMTKMQKMATKAIEIIQQKAKNENAVKDYKPRMNGFPVMILQSGLAQASGFYLAKGAMHAEYLNDVADVLQAAGGWTFPNSGMGFHQRSIGCDAVTYRLLTRDALDAAGWLKRYGTAIL